MTLVLDHSNYAPAGAPVELEPITAPIICGGCGETFAPDGVCLNVGACRVADRAAVRGSLRIGAPGSVRAWNLGGNVD